MGNLGIHAKFPKKLHDLMASCQFFPGICSTFRDTIKIRSWILRKFLGTYGKLRDTCKISQARARLLAPHPPNPPPLFPAMGRLLFLSLFFFLSLSLSLSLFLPLRAVLFSGMGFGLESLNGTIQNPLNERDYGFLEEDHPA